MQEMDEMDDMKIFGVPASALAREYGTPLYVMSEDVMRERIASAKAAFDERYERCLTHFAAKSYITRDMLRLVKRSGIGLDVVSGGEMHLARECGIDPRLVTFHGSSKTDDEIAAGLDWGVGEFVCDSESEIATIGAAARARGTAARVILRVNPETTSHTHAYMATAAGSKFGVARADLRRAVELCLSTQGVELKGYHFHAGSQLMEPSSHIAAADAVLAEARAVYEATGYAPRALDFGGGFGVAYTDDDSPSPIGDFIEPLVARAEAFARELGMRRPDLAIEPGRYIAAEAGVTLYTVCSTKRAADGTLWVGVDGGYPDNPRPEMYGARYRAVSASRPHAPATTRTVLAGKCCESGDIIIAGIDLPESRRGDLIALLVTGAYHSTMANNYNKNPLPALVTIADGVPRLSVRRQTYAQLFENDL